MKVFKSIFFLYIDEVPVCTVEFNYYAKEYGIKTNFSHIISAESHTEAASWIVQLSSDSPDIIIILDPDQVHMKPGDKPSSVQLSSLICDSQGISPSYTPDSQGISPSYTADSQGISPSYTADSQGISPSYTADSQGISPSYTPDSQGISPSYTPDSQGISPSYTADSQGIFSSYEASLSSNSQSIPAYSLYVVAAIVLFAIVCTLAVVFVVLYLHKKHIGPCCNCQPNPNNVNSDIELLVYN